MAKALNRHLTREDILMENMKRCSISYILHELQMKTPRYHYTHIRWLEYKHWQHQMLERMWSKYNYTADENANWYSHFGRLFGTFLQN